jgi:hypothetical protein
MALDIGTGVATIATTIATAIAIVIQPSSTIYLCRRVTGI